MDILSALMASGLGRYKGRDEQPSKHRNAKRTKGRKRIIGGDRARILRNKERERLRDRDRS